MPDNTVRRIRLAHLYPEVMDLYGDSGNVVALSRRCEWRGISLEVDEVRFGDRLDLTDTDLIFIGGGQDTGQTHVAHDLAAHGEAIRGFVERGGAALAVCAGFQLFGNSYSTQAGREITGIGVFDAHTVAGPGRIIGNSMVATSAAAWGAFSDSESIPVVGFENHAGRTHLGPGARPFGDVIDGGGNLGDATTEGAVYGNAVGTYLHGPLLPKNPRIADRLIAAALVHRYGGQAELEPLDDELERRAHEAAVARCVELSATAGHARLAG